MKARDALHHPLTRTFATNVNVTVVCVANEAVSAVLQFPVEFVEHEFVEHERYQQWRKRSSLPRMTRLTRLGHWPITIRIFWTCRCRPNEQLNFSVYAAFRIFVLQDRPHPFAGLLE